MRKTLAIIRLKILQTLRTPGLFLIMLLLPILFTYVMGNMGSGKYRIPVAVVDLDQSVYSQKYKEELSKNSSYVLFSTHEAEARDRVRNNKAIAAIILPEGFEQAIRNGSSLEIKLIQIKESFEVVGLRNELQGKLAFLKGNIRLADYTLSQIKEGKNVLGREQEIWERAYKNALSQWSPYPPVYSTLKTMENYVAKSSTPMTHASIGFSFFFVMYTIIFGVSDILEEKKLGTWQRLLTLPITKVQLLGGHLISTFIIGFVQILLLILLGIYLFGVNWGSSLSVILWTAGTFVFAITCFGLFLSAMVKTPAQLHTLTPIVTVVSAMLGGTFWPLDMVKSKILLLLAKLTPQYWAISNIQGMIYQGKSLQESLFPIFILLFMGILYFILGLKLLKWEHQ